jgi:hypothetical protein
VREPSPVGFGGVSGVVLSDVTGKPLQRALVILQPLDADALSRLATTTETGTFELAAVKNGRYEFVVQRDGYLSIGGSGPRFGSPPPQVTVSNNARLGSFVFRMHPAGVIAGRVRYGSDAEPAVGALVELYREHRIRGRHGFDAVAGALTDDRGEYRIHGVPPGSYYVAAARQRPPEAAGAVEEPRRDARGFPLPDEAMAVTFYPNGPKLVEAVPVKIAYGSEALGIDIFLESVPSTRIRGRVTSAMGVPDSISIVVDRADARDGAAIRASYDVAIDKRGEFEIQGVTPGPYVLLVEATAGAYRFSARRFVGVANTPVDNLEILVEPPLLRRGSVLVAGAAANVAANVRVALEPRDQSAGVASAITGENGGYSVVLEPGVSYDALVSNLPAGTYVKSIRAGYRDVLRNGLLTEGLGENDTIDIVLGTDGAKVVGGVVDPSGMPASGAVVTLIPDPSAGRLQQYASGAVAADGSFALSGVAPGHYLILASASDPPCDIYDPADLGACRRVAQPIDPGSSGQVFLALPLR